MVLQRTAHGLSFNINYTYSKNIGDDATFRSGFDIPAAAISGNAQSWHQDRIERSWSVVSSPQILHAFGVSTSFPSAKTTWAQTPCGFALSLVPAVGRCPESIPTAPALRSRLSPAHAPPLPRPLQGQCMPDVAPGATNARINGSYGTSPNGTSACNLGIGPNCTAISYVDSKQFKNAANVSATSSPIYLIGNAARTAPLTLRGPGNQDLDAALRRSFNLPKEIGTFVFEVDCINVWNKVVFNTPASTFGSSNFGTISGVSGSPGPRDFQFAGHLNF